MLSRLHTLAALVLLATATIVQNAGSQTRTTSSFSERLSSVADGRADATSTIQQTVAEARGAIRLPPGKYRLTQPVEIDLTRVGVTSIAGDGVARLIMQGAGPALKFLGTHGGTADPKSVQADVFESQRMPMVDGIEIIGEHPLAEGIYAEGTLQLTISRVNIRKTLHGIHLVKRNRNVQISECHIYDNFGIGIFLDDVNLHQINVNSSHISYNQGGGVVSRKGQVRNLQIGTCDIEANQSPTGPATANVLLDCTGGSIAEVAITGCTLQHSPHPESANIRMLGRSDEKTRNGPRIINWGHVTITGNVLSDVQYNIDLDGARGVTIEGNTFWQGYKHNLRLANCSNIVIGPNIMDRNPRYQVNGEGDNSILIENSRECTVSGLQLKEANGASAAFELRNSQRLHVSSCTILDSTLSALKLTDCINCRIANCMILGQQPNQNAKPAIEVRGGSGNQITSNMIDGEVVCDSAHGQVDGNSKVPKQASGSSIDKAALLEKATSVLAQLDGTLAISGLSRPVQVLRDRWGIPHIYAENQHDLFFAQGVVAAQDRLYQIDMWRRLSVGETSEVLGPESLVRDHFARLTKYRGDMQREWQSYSSDTQEIAAAFTRGINAYIDHIGDRLPIEFQVIGYQPKKWRPEDVLGRLSVLAVSRNLDAEVNRAALVAAVGLDKARFILPTDPLVNYAPDPTLDLAGINSSILRGYTAANSSIAFAPGGESNNWAIDGTLSRSGKPMMASDPHRAIALPSLRYIVHLNAPGWNVIGGGEPGLPGVALGHNERIAWGFTVVGTDQADLIVEQLNPANHSQYRKQDAWESLRVIRETVNVRKLGKLEPTELELKFTHHGPVIHVDQQHHRAYVLRWMGAEPGTAAYLASLAIDRARNWHEFLAATARWHAPSENIVYADVDGNIGWIAAALTPVRGNWNGLLPVPGHDDRYNWRGFLNASELPQIANPASHYIITANHNILPSGYQREIGYEWAPGSRFERLKELVESKKQFTLDDFKSMQYDTTSMIARELIIVLRGVPFADAVLARHASALIDWNGASEIESSPAALFALWYQELGEAFFGDRVPKELLSFVANAGTQRMVNELKQPSQKWFGSAPVAHRDSLIISTLQRAVMKAQEKLGADSTRWSLGQLRRMHFKHPLTKLGPDYAALDLSPLPSGSSAHAPNQARYDAEGNRLHGATYRHVFDLADWDQGQATSAPGQSGQPGSPYYANLVESWHRGEYIPLAYSKEKVESVTAHRLTLVPGK